VAIRGREWTADGSYVDGIASVGHVPRRSPSDKAENIARKLESALLLTAFQRANAKLAAGEAPETLADLLG
jgi:hypothetical protein